jgi:hypothetical protein
MKEYIEMSPIFTGAFSSDFSSSFDGASPMHAGTVIICLMIDLLLSRCPERHDPIVTRKIGTSEQALSC